MALVLYVDDILIASNDLHALSDFKSHLHELFTIKDLGPVKYFLGMKFSRSEEGIYLSQRKYVIDLFTDSGMIRCKPMNTPLPAGIQCS